MKREIRVTSDCRRILIYYGARFRSVHILDFPHVDACLRALARLRHSLNCDYVDISTGYRVTHAAPFDCYACST